MVTLKLAPGTAARLAASCAATGGDGAATEHWRHFGGMNRVRFAPDGHVAIEAGAGFDGEFELNFRTRGLRERLGLVLRALTGNSANALYSRAFRNEGGTDERLRAALEVLGSPLQAHKLLAAHYLDLLERHDALSRVGRYLEIGPGAGYLAALAHARTGCRLVLVDLPGMLPLSFLYLHRRFPQASFRLPGEAAMEAQFTFLAPERLDEVPAASVDLAVNTASFGEMLPAQVADYFAFLRRTAAPGSLFFTVNREEKLMRSAIRPGEPVPVRFDEYPWRAKDRDLLHRRSQFHDLVQPGNAMRVRLCHLETS